MTSLSMTTLHAPSREQPYLMYDDTMFLCDGQGWHRHAMPCWWHLIEITSNVTWRLSVCVCVCDCMFLFSCLFVYVRVCVWVCFHVNRSLRTSAECVTWFILVPCFSWKRNNVCGVQLNQLFLIFPQDENKQPVSVFLISNTFSIRASCFKVIE